jgi:predicted RNA-binding Zn-ribbon protein involved in translation (DUF1610 family)
MTPKQKAKFSRARFDRRIAAELKKRLLCQLCGSNKLTKYKKVRNNTQEIEYLCYCPDCGFEGDMFHINDLVYYWSKLPVRRVFDSYSDYRDEGGKIEKHRIDYDAKWDDPKRVRKV